MENCEQYLLPSRQHLLQGRPYFSRTKLNHILHLFQQHGFVAEESGCWTDLPAVLTFNHLKTFTFNKEDPGILYQTGIGQHSSPKGPAAGLLSSRCLQMLLKEEGMLHSGKHGPVPTFMRRVAAITFK